MKKIFAILMLMAVAKGSPAWGDYQTGQWNRGFQPQTQWYSPSGYSPSLSGPAFGSPGQGFLPPGHSHVPPGHQQIPPGHMYSTQCQVLDQLVKLHVNNPSNSLDKNCNLGWICHNPKTEDMTITTIDGTQIIIAKQQPSNNWPNQNVVDNNENVMNDGPTQGNPDNGNLPNENSTPAAINPTTPHTNDESSRREGGEGLIDVRISNI